MKQSKIRFVTLFPRCPNVGLVKDVGQIPYTLAKVCDKIETKLVSSEIDFTGANIDRVKGLEIEYCPYILHNEFLTGIWYLLKNARKIDWLNIYHCGRKSYYWAKLYKILNRKGKVYLKLDLDFVSCDIYDQNRKERELFRKVTNAMDLVSVESKAVYERISKYTDHEIQLISNGYCVQDEIIELPDKRENCFITVGRLGTKQKATEVLLEAFAKSAPFHNWKLKLIGSVEPEFEKIKESFLANNEKVAKRIIFKGMIDDRKQLYMEYCKAKVMVLPSRWESFALVGPEAISCGCRILVSDQVPSMHEVTCEGRYGQIIPVDNVDAWAQAMVDAAKLEYTKEGAEEIADYAKEHFSWERICMKLQNYLI